MNSKDKSKVGEEYEDGKVLLIDKPYSWTSFDVVAKVRNWQRKLYGKKVKVGHAGTLDPLATGLLIVCVGKFTKRIEEFQAKEKEYSGSFILGSSTKSFDLETEVFESGDYTKLSPQDIEAAAKSFLGKSMQKPPLFSAVKINGKRAYSLARKDKEVELPEKEIEIFSFDITAIELPRVDFLIRCSKGTYIRAIARDFGERLGCGAYMSALRREAIGDFRVSEALDIRELCGGAGLRRSEPMLLDGSGDGDGDGGDGCGSNHAE